jgi:hypothetical protein
MKLKVLRDHKMLIKKTATGIIQAGATFKQTRISEKHNCFMIYSSAGNGLLPAIGTVTSLTFNSGRIIYLTGYDTHPAYAISDAYAWMEGETSFTTDGFAAGLNFVYTEGVY